VCGHSLLRSNGSDYALEMTAMELKGHLSAEPGIRATGGISMARAKIGADINGQGVHLEPAPGWTVILLGWALSTIFVAGFMGIVKK
jgi:hypothetical protein